MAIKAVNIIVKSLKNTFSAVLFVRKKNIYEQVIISEEESWKHTRNCIKYKRRIFQKLWTLIMWLWILMNSLVWVNQEILCGTKSFGQTSIANFRAGRRLCNFVTKNVKLKGIGEYVRTYMATSTIINFTFSPIHSCLLYTSPSPRD